MWFFFSNNKFQCYPLAVIVILLFCHFLYGFNDSGKNITQVIEKGKNNLVIGKVSHDPKKHFRYLKPMVDYAVKQMGDLGMAYFHKPWLSLRIHPGETWADYTCVLNRLIPFFQKNKALKIIRDAKFKIHIFVSALIRKEQQNNRTHITYMILIFQLILFLLVL